MVVATGVFFERAHGYATALGDLSIVPGWSLQHVLELLRPHRIITLAVWQRRIALYPSQCTPDMCSNSI
jgi:hypothetical protein